MRKLDGKAVTAGSVGSSGPLALVFFALNIDTPNRWEDLYKREAIARGHSYIHSSTTAQQINAADR